jgi:inorganic pyrophosphatase
MPWTDERDHLPGRALHGNAERNDRLLAVRRRSRSEQALRDVRNLSKPIQEELKKFFIATDELEDKKPEIIGWRSPKVAPKAIKEAGKSFGKSGESVQRRKRSVRSAIGDTD